MKAMFLTAALLAAATTASAGELTGEARFADTRNVKGSSEAVLTYTADVPAAYASYLKVPSAYVTGLTWGAEASSLQPEHSGAVSTKLDVHAGAKLALINGVAVVPAVEVGQSYQQGHDAPFWGVGATASYPVTERVSVDTGFRYRQSLRNATDINEDRYNFGASYAVAKDTKVGLEYYRTTGTVHSDAVGLKVARSF